MSESTMTQEEIRQTGLEALARELGPAGMIRFLQQFERGQGDYSVERLSLLGNKSVAELAEEIQQQRK